MQGDMMVQEGNKMGIEKAHDLLGHCNEDATRATAKHLGWELSRGAKPCQSCAEAQAKQKIVPKKTKGKKASRPAMNGYFKTWLRSRHQSHWM